MKYSPRLPATLLSAALLLSSWPQAVFAVELEGPGRTPGQTPIVAPIIPGANLEIQQIPALPVSSALDALTQPLGLAETAAPSAAQAPATASAAATASVPAVAKAKAGLAAVFAMGARLAAVGARPQSAPRAQASPELGAQAGAAAFDGARGLASREPLLTRLAGKVGYGAGWLARRTLGQSLATRLIAKKEKIPTPYDPDKFGGPQEANLSFMGRVKAGAREGLKLVGLATALQWTLKPIFAVIPWQLHVSQSLLNASGRVELLTRFGPAEIIEKLQSSPLSFMTLQLAQATFWEEAVFRILTLGGAFLFINGLAAAARSTAKWLENVPDLFNLRHTGQRALAFVGKISSKAFPIAAAYSTWSFMSAHFANWGIDPYTMAVNGILGLALARLAYKTRGITAPTVAHFVYNFLTLSVLAVTLNASSLVGLAYSLFFSAASLAFLAWNWRSERKDKKATIAQIKADHGAGLRGGAAGLMLVLALALGVGGSLKPEAATTVSHRATATQVLVQEPAVPAKDEAPAQAEPAAKAEEKPLTADWAADLTEKTMPSVVMVRMAHSLGSGFIVSPEGLLVTNNHVAGEVGIGGQVLILFSDGSRAKAKVVALNPEKDIALIQLPAREDGQPYPALAIYGGKLRVGERVMTLGNPKGLAFSVSDGIVSGLGGEGRSSKYVDYIQTNAAINPGNSGGPLVNKDGDVIGINTWIIAQSNNLGFAISSQDLIATLQQYAATGKINSAYLGLIFNTEDPDAPEAGVRIEVVRPGSPAALAGIRAGDVVVAVNGNKLGGDADDALKALSLGLARSKSGDKLVISVARDDKVLNLTPSLGDKPQ